MLVAHSAVRRRCWDHHWDLGHMLVMEQKTKAKIEDFLDRYLCAEDFLEWNSKTNT